jgi:hypothetical protein
MARRGYDRIHLAFAVEMAGCEPCRVNATKFSRLQMESDISVTEIGNYRHRICLLMVLNLRLLCDSGRTPQLQAKR